MGVYRWIMVSFVLIFLAGCTMSEEEKTQYLIGHQSLETSVAKSLETSFFTVGQWPEAKWWEVFGSERLNSLMEVALDQNPTLQNVEQRVELAKQEAMIARSKLLPLLFFNGSDNWAYLSKNGLYKAFNPSLPRNAYDVDLTLAFTYEFDFWSKYRNRFRAAIGRQKAEEAQQAQVELIVTTSVAQAYFALKTNLIKSRLLRELFAAQKGILGLQNSLLKNALYSKIPVYLAKENVLEVEKQIEAVEEEIATDRHLLNILVGQGPDTKLDVDTALPPLPKSIVIPETLSAELLSRRPDLMASIWRVEAWAHEVGAARAEYLPNINLAANLGVESVTWKKLFYSSSITPGILPSFSLPVYTADEIQANIDAKLAEFYAALQDYNDLVLKSAAEVADMLVISKSIFAQHEDQVEIVACAKSRYELIQLRQKKGLDNSLQNYALQIEVLQKQLDDIDLIFGQYLTTVKLIKSLGGGYFSDFVPISKGCS
jgi:NodT family efflux transporter outer membrane factor (OMF) lipoprotein